MTSLFRRADQRILALWFPYLASDRVLRRRHGKTWRCSARNGAQAETGRPASMQAPLVFSRAEQSARRIAALDERAEALGLKVGMGLADARAMHPNIEILEANAPADHRLLIRLADWCDRYTPLVSLDGTQGLFLDITGCAHLFGGEAALRRDLLQRLREQGFDARAALASTPGAAWAGARFGLETIAPGAEAEALGRLPLAALRLDAATRTSLESVGLRTVDLVLEAPRAPLARRFGKALILEIDRMLGLVDEPLSPRLPVPALSVERRLAEPIMVADDIEHLVLLLAQSLKSALERRGEGARRLGLALFRVDGVVYRLAVGTARPVRDPQWVAKLFRERLAALESDFDAGFGFDLVRLSVCHSAPLPAHQIDLAGDGCDGTAADLALFVDRVSARFGGTAVLRAVAAASHIPERAVATVPFAEAAAKPGSIVVPERPLRLLHRPEPVEVMAEVPEGPPVHFRWRRVHYSIARAEGPERISPEWWLESAAKIEVGEDEDPQEARKRTETMKTASSTRDYFRVEDADGRRYWLYRQGLYGMSDEAPRWFLQGLFA